MNIFMIPTVVSIRRSNGLTGENVSRFAVRKAPSRFEKYCVAAAFALLAISSPHAQEKAPEPTGSKPAATKSKPAAKRSAEPPAKSAASVPTRESSVEADSAGLKAVEEIFACVAQGLPEGWQRAWVVVTELAGDLKERRFEGRFQVSLEASGDKRWDYVPCNSRQVAESVYRLNDFLEPEKRHWRTATLLFLREGRFELKYDYSR